MNYSDDTADEFAAVQDKIRRGRRLESRQHARSRDGCAAPAAARSDVTTLSGGGVVASRCAACCWNADLLLLDEPTNHLDAESVAWLERFLKDYRGTVVAITHDRYFLDNVAGWIPVDRGQGIPWEGNYSSWLSSIHLPHRANSVWTGGGEVAHDADDVGADGARRGPTGPCRCRASGAPARLRDHTPVRGDELEARGSRLADLSVGTGPMTRIRASEDGTEDAGPPAPLRRRGRRARRKRRGAETSTAPCRSSLGLDDRPQLGTLGGTQQHGGVRRIAPRSRVKQDRSTAPFPRWANPRVSRADEHAARLLDLRLAGRVEGV